MRWRTCWPRQDCSRPPRVRRKARHAGLVCTIRRGPNASCSSSCRSAASQCDTCFDYKPELVKRNGQPWDPSEKVELFQSTPGNCMQSPWAWSQHGECGHWMSSLVPELATAIRN